MAEEVRAIRVTIEVETNKRSIKHVVAWNDQTLSATADRINDILTQIEADMYQ